jgi:hypothetical protein
LTASLFLFLFPPCPFNEQQEESTQPSPHFNGFSQPQCSEDTSTQLAAGPCVMRFTRFRSRLGVEETMQQIEQACDKLNMHGQYTTQHHNNTVHPNPSNTHKKEKNEEEGGGGGRETLFGRLS